MNSIIRNYRSKKFNHLHDESAEHGLNLQSRQIAIMRKKLRTFSLEMAP